MSAQEVAEAQAELAARLSPSALAFLKSRGQRSAADAPPAHAAPPLPALPPMAPPGGGARTGAASVRFTVQGDLLSAQATATAFASRVPAASSRDPLRTDGEPDGAGYSLHEAATLARSAVPAQRTAALRLLAGALGHIPRGMAAACTSAPMAAPADGVSWAALYVHALRSHRLPLLLRTALDDNAPSVCAAAAAAIAALLAPHDEEAAWERVDAAGCCDSSLDHLQSASPHTAAHLEACRHPAAPHWRPRAGAAWEAVTSSSCGRASDEGAPDDADEDAVDPAAALLRMSFTLRARFLLEAARNGAAARPLLRSLLALARHGGASARQVGATPRLLSTLRSEFLEAAPPAGCSALSCGEDGAALEFWLCRPVALKLLRVLVETGPASLAIAVAQEGLLAAAVGRFAPLAARSSTPEQPASHTLRREALRLWRAAALAGARVPPADDLFPVLCAALHPPSTAVCDPAAWAACRDVLRLMSVLADAHTQPGAALSPPAAAAVAAAACAWTAPDVLRSVQVAAVEARGSALAALAAAMCYVAKHATPQAALLSATQVVAAAGLEGLPDGLQGPTGAPSFFPSLLRDIAAGDDAAMGAGRAMLALLRRAAAPAADAADAGSPAAALAAGRAASGLLDALAPELQRLAADDGAKEVWQPAPARAHAASLCLLSTDALCLLSAHGAHCATRCASAAVAVAAAAPPGCEALVRRALNAGLASHRALTELLVAAPRVAAYWASQPGSASAVEAAESGAGESQGALCAQMPAMQPRVRAACRARLAAAAGLPASDEGAAGGEELWTGAGSRLPAPAAWPLRALAQAPSASDWAADSAAGLSAPSEDALATLLALNLALEEPQNVPGPPSCMMPPASPAVKLRLLGAAFAAAPGGAIRGGAARALLAALADCYTASLRAHHLACCGSRDDDQDPAAAAAAATVLCESFADASFGDALQGRLVALCLRAGAPMDARAAAVHALRERACAHLLPPLSCFAFGQGGQAGAAALFTPPSGEPSAQVLRLWTDFLCSGRDYQRALTAQALPATIADHALCCAARALHGDALGADAGAALTALMRKLSCHGPQEGPLKRMADEAVGV